MMSVGLRVLGRGTYDGVASRGGEARDKDGRRSIRLTQPRLLGQGYTE